MNFVIPGQPVGKARARISFNRFTGKNQSYTPKKTADYEKLVRLSYQKSLGNINTLPPTEKPVRMILNAFYGIPSSWTKKKKVMAVCNEIYPTSKPDLSNILKSVEDALNGIAYKDDSQIVDIEMSKQYSLDARVEVTILEVYE